MSKLAISILFFTLAAYGDFTSAPHTKVAVSGMGHVTSAHVEGTVPGDIIVRVQEFEPSRHEPKSSPEKATGFGDPFILRGKRLPKPIVSVHRYNERERIYKKMYEFEIESVELAEVIVPDNKGERLAFIYLDRNNAGLRLFSDKGSKSTYWPIKDFLRKKHRDITAESVTTVQWFDSGRFSSSSFSFKGPSQDMDLSFMEKHHPEAVRAIRKGYHFNLTIEAGKFQEWEYEEATFKFVPVKSKKVIEEKSK